MTVHCNTLGTEINDLWSIVIKDLMNNLNVSPINNNFCDDRFDFRCHSESGCLCRYSGFKCLWCKHLPRENPSVGAKLKKVSFEVISTTSTEYVFR